MIITFLIISIILISCIYATFCTNRDTKEVKNHLKEAELWLEEQNKLPKYKVSFAVDNHIPKHTESFEPTYNNYMYWLYLSSLTRATDELEKFYKQGYFVDRDGVTYPVCQVKYAKIEKEF